MTPFDLFDDGARRPGGRLTGLAIGKVSNVDDPDELGRVRVTLPRISADAESTWARVMRPAAGASHGLHLPFEIGDEVVIAFVDGFAETPVILGALWSAKQPPLVGQAKRQDQRTLTSRSGHTVRLDDTKDAERIEIVDAAGKNTLTFDTAKGEVTICAENKIVVKAGKSVDIASPDAEVTISCKALTVTASDGVTLGGGAIALESDDAVTINGPSGVNINDGALEVT
ncbi:MAG: phage baseplate assembly protein V [Nannocystaceae bacterium]